MGKQPRKRTLRPTYRQRTDREVIDDLKASIQVGSATWDWLTEIRLECNYQTIQTLRDEAEGTRKLAERIQTMILEPTEG